MKEAVYSLKITSEKDGKNNFYQENIYESKV